jgi:hypothetical protein
MGVGAFAYYRRVVENQKNRLLDEVIRVSQHTGAATETILLFEQAKSETQFSKAVDLVKDAVPQVFRVDTHNPLTAYELRGKPLTAYRRRPRRKGPR